MFRCLFLAFYILCNFIDTRSWAMVSGDVVYEYLKNNAIVCFHSELSENDFNKKLGSKKISDKINCVDVCGTMLRESLFSSRQCFEDVFSMIDVGNIPDDSELQKTAEILSRINRRSGTIVEDESEDVFLKLALFAPTSTNELKLKDWLLRADRLFNKERDNNYELSDFSSQYTLEMALYIIFCGVKFSFWGLDSEEDKLSCVKYFCGAIRTYLLKIGKIKKDIAPVSCKPSYVAILRECYDVYSRDSKKNR